MKAEELANMNLSEPVLEEPPLFGARSHSPWSHGAGGMDATELLELLVLLFDLCHSQDVSLGCFKKDVSLGCSDGWILDLSGLKFSICQYSWPARQSFENTTRSKIEYITGSTSSNRHVRLLETCKHLKERFRYILQDVRAGPDLVKAFEMQDSGQGVLSVRLPMIIEALSKEIGRISQRVMMLSLKHSDQEAEVEACDTFGGSSSSSSSSRLWKEGWKKFLAPVFLSHERKMKAKRLVAAAVKSECRTFFQRAIQHLSPFVDKYARQVELPRCCILKDFLGKSTC